MFLSNQRCMLLGISESLTEQAETQDPDPTVAAVAAYDMTATEIVVGWFLLAATPLMYLGWMKRFPYAFVTSPNTMRD